MDLSSIMQKNVITAPPTMSLAQAQRLMREHNIRHLPVVAGNKLVGIVTDRDIREASPSPATTLSRGEIAYQMDNTKIETCMSKRIVQGNPAMDVMAGARLLLSHAIGCLPVVDNDRLVGLVSEIDFLRTFIENPPLTVSDSGSL